MTADAQQNLIFYKILLYLFIYFPFYYIIFLFIFQILSAGRKEEGALSVLFYIISLAQEIKLVNCCSSMSISSSTK